MKQGDDFFTLGKDNFFYIAVNRDRNAPSIIVTKLGVIRF